MKKMIAALVILAVMVGGAVWEIIYTKTVFSELDSRLASVDALIESDMENVNTPETLAAMDEVMNLWFGSKGAMHAILNHTAVRLVDEKLDMLMGYIKVNANKDASVTVKSARTLINDLKDDNLPLLGNLL